MSGVKKDTPYNAAKPAQSRRQKCAILLQVRYVLGDEPVYAVGYIILDLASGLFKPGAIKCLAIPGGSAIIDLKSHFDVPAISKNCTSSLPLPPYNRGSSMAHHGSITTTGRPVVFDPWGSVRYPLISNPSRVLKETGFMAHSSSGLMLEFISPSLDNFSPSFS